MTKAGRPPKYKTGEIQEAEYIQSHPQKLLELMSAGKLDCEIYASFGVCKDTYYEWLRSHPEFKKAHEVGLPQCEAWWIQWGMRGMQGEIKGFNFNSWIAFMNNKFKWAKNALGETNSSTTNISIGNMNILQQKPKADLIEYIKTMGQKHQEVIDVEFIESKLDQKSK